MGLEIGKKNNKKCWMLSVWCIEMVAIVFTDVKMTESTLKVQLRWILVGLENVHWPKAFYCVTSIKTFFLVSDKIMLFDKATCSWSFVHSHFLCKNLNAVCADYLIIFRDSFRIFFATFFQKQASKYHLTQGNLLKTTLFNEKQSNPEKEMYQNISLYCQYFSPGTGKKINKTYFYLIVYKKTGEWYIEWESVVPQVTTNDNQCYNKWQQMKMSDSEWPFRLNFLFSK